MASVPCFLIRDCGAGGFGEPCQKAEAVIGPQLTRRRASAGGFFVDPSLIYRNCLRPICVVGL